MFYVLCYAYMSSASGQTNLHPIETVVREVHSFAFLNFVPQTQVVSSIIDFSIGPQKCITPKCNIILVISAHHE